MKLKELTNILFQWELERVKSIFVCRFLQGFLLSAATQASAADERDVRLVLARSVSRGFGGQ